MGPGQAESTGKYAIVSTMVVGAVYAGNRRPGATASLRVPDLHLRSKHWQQQGRIRVRICKSVKFPLPGQFCRSLVPCIDLRLSGTPAAVSACCVVQ